MTPEQIGSYARQKRRELSLRQQDLADLAGVSDRLIRDIEHGKPTVQLNTLLRVLNVLGLHIQLTEFDALRQENA